MYNMVKEINISKFYWHFYQLYTMIKHSRITS